MTVPELSVVVLTWNDERHVRTLLDSLLGDAGETSIALEVLIVDNGSSDDTLAIIRDYQKRYPQIVLVSLSKNHGTTVTRNIAVKMARADTLLVLDSDTEIPPGTLKTLLDWRAHVPDPDKVGIVCPRLIYPDGEFQESARRFPTMLTKAYRLLHLDTWRARDESIEAVVQGRPGPVDYAISAAWLVPKTTFQRVGFFDESIFYAPEDVEFCARVWSRGLCVWYDPRAVIVHNCQRLTNRRPLSLLGLSHAKGLFRYWLRYGSFLRRHSARG